MNSFVPLQQAILFYGVSEYFLTQWYENGHIKIKRTKRGHRLFEIDSDIPSKTQEKLCDNSFVPIQEAMLFYDVTIATLTKWQNNGDIQIKRTKKGYRLFEIDAGIPLRVKCTKRQKKLCEKEKCEICPERSFENHPKAVFWSEKNEKKPRDICRGSDDLVWFNCNICRHEFQSQLSNITRKKKGSWCPFCAKRKVCKDKTCNFCKANSFASHPKAEFWSEKNENIKPRDLLKCSNDKFWFNCRLGHEFKSQLNSITRKRGSWCPGCNNKTEQQLYEWLKKIYPSDHIITP